MTILFNHNIFQLFKEISSITLSEVNGLRYVGVAIDYFSKWCEASALPDTTAKSVARWYYLFSWLPKSRDQRSRERVLQLFIKRAIPTNWHSTLCYFTVPSIGSWFSQKIKTYNKKYLFESKLISKNHPNLYLYSFTLYLYV